VAGRRREWLQVASGFTLSGVAASLAVGALIGGLGEFMLLDQIPVAAALTIALLAVVALAQELGVVSIPLPQPRRQTREAWGKLYSRQIAAMLWGFDLGLIVTTWFTFSGTAVVLALALASGSPMFGAALLSAHWLGRASSVWLGPMLLPDPNATPRLMDRIDAARPRFHTAHVIAVLWLTTVLVITAASRASI
jgi:hypothetical protein